MGVEWELDCGEAGKRGTDHCEGREEIRVEVARGTDSFSRSRFDCARSWISKRESVSF